MPIVHKSSFFTTVFTNFAGTDLIHLTGNEEDMYHVTLKIRDDVLVSKEELIELSKALRDFASTLYDKP